MGLKEGHVSNGVAVGRKVSVVLMMFLRISMEDGDIIVFDVKRNGKMITYLSWFRMCVCPCASVFCGHTAEVVMDRFRICGRGRRKHSTCIFQTLLKTFLVDQQESVLSWYLRERTQSQNHS